MKKQPLAVLALAALLGLASCGETLSSSSLPVFVCSVPITENLLRIPTM